ncbi:Six-hairpin glycosidase [Xylariaceae sp. FL0255]|nr:Six-hairpin glycosidase [Xylariaceae sp. FL0255]
MAEKPSQNGVASPPLGTGKIDRNLSPKGESSLLPQHVTTTANGLPEGAQYGRLRCVLYKVDGFRLFIVGLCATILAILVVVLAYTVMAPHSLSTSLGDSLPGQAVNAVVTGTSFLDHDAPISGFLGRTFLKENIPYLDIPDSLIQDVYYYRWSSIQRHLRYTTAGTGYLLTEFMQSVGYAQAFGSIDAAAGHQIDESRWFRDTVYGDDYIQLYTRGPADPLQYTQWILDAASRRAMVTGDEDYFSSQLDDLIRVWHLWDSVYDSDAGLYYYEPNWDAQEYSLPGFVADADGTNSTLRLNGPNTFRPSHNSYMVANARAISKAAELVNDGFNEAKFSQIADDLETAMYQRLWAPEQEFFMDIIRPGNPNFTTLTGREEVGLYPYRFGIGLNETYAQPALDSMFDTQGFLSPYGPTTLEIRNEWFNATLDDPSYCCWWNGQSWPFSTAHSLKSLAAIYRSNATNATADQYVDYLRMYAITQQKNGVPYVAESHYPYLDEWSADSYNHSENYDHSTNNDDVITGLIGIIPQADDTLVISPIIPDNWTYFCLEDLAYHGHLVTVLYDADGSRYNVGSGLHVYVDGSSVHQGDSLTATVAVPPAILPGVAPINIAANPTGTGYYPMANATFTYVSDYEFKAIDGVVFYDQVPDNRWTNYQSPNANDTLSVTFARPRNVSSVTLAVYSDVARGGAVDVPESIEIYGPSGLITTVAGSGLLANDKNEITFDEIETTFLSINMYKQSSTWVGLCEVEVWTWPESGPTYYAVDAYLTGAATNVVFDKKSKATANGAVVGGIETDSTVAFSGIVSTGTTSQLTLSYANQGNTTVTVDVQVNQVGQTTLSLAPSKGQYVDVSAQVTLASGKNFISLIGGSATTGVTFETLTID